MPDPPVPPARPSPMGMHGLDPGELLARGLQSVRPTGDGRWVPPEATEVARLLPQYEIEGLLGRGGMGAVYKGRQRSLDRPIAIKLLPVEMSADSQFVARFQREARTLARLHHSGIVSIYDSGQTSEGHLYFVMEYVDGTDLRKVLRASGLQAGPALALISQVCDALQAAHRQGVMHRDIKPENILLNKEGNIKLADFGLARPMNEEEEDGLTGTNIVMGTPAYMAPEQHEGKSDHRSDLFALGATLHELLTGRPPRGVVTPPSQRYRVDVRIDEVVLRALQSEPELRYQSAVEMKSAVDRILTGGPVYGGRGAPPPSQPRAVAPAKPRPRSRSLAITLLTVLAIAAGAGLWRWKAAFPDESISPGAGAGTTPGTAPANVSPEPVRSNMAPLPAPPPKSVPGSATAEAPVATKPAPPAPPPSIAKAPPPGIGAASGPATPPVTVALKPLQVVQTLSLLNGEHLKGWSQAGPGGFRLSNGVATSWSPPEPGGSGICWYTQRSFADLILKVEFKTLQPSSQSGIILRSPHPVASGAAGQEGYEVPIYGAAYAKHPVAPLRPDGWSELEVKVVGQKYTIHLDGRLVNEFTGNRALRGYIGLQNQRSGTVQMRNLEISELAPSASVESPRLNSTLLAHTWKWWVKGTDPNGALPRPLYYRFEANGVVSHLGSAGYALWRATGPRTFTVTPEAPWNIGLDEGALRFTFNDDFTQYQGTSANGDIWRGWTDVPRREAETFAVDPRIATEPSALDPQSPLAKALFSREWIWWAKGTDPRGRAPSWSPYRFESNGVVWRADSIGFAIWRATGPRSFVVCVEPPWIIGMEEGAVEFTFNDEFTEYQGHSATGGLWRGWTQMARTDFAPSPKPNRQTTAERLRSAEPAMPSSPLTKALQSSEWKWASKAGDPNGQAIKPPAYRFEPNGLVWCLAVPGYATWRVTGPKSFVVVPELPWNIGLDEGAVEFTCNDDFTQYRGTAANGDVWSGWAQARRK